MAFGRHLQKEIRELSLKASDGQLSDDERARLNQLVESDDEACRVLLAYSNLDADLVFHARSAEAAERVENSICSRSTGRRSARLRAIGDASGRSSRRWAVARWGGGLAAAAGLAFVLAGGPSALKSALTDAAAPRQLAQRQPQPIASLTLAPNAVFEDSSLSVGDAFLEQDELVLTQGEAHVSMASGADFVLKSPGAVRFVTSKHVQLLRGEMTAQVAEWGTGFTVDTDTMRVIDLGTRFAIAASTGDVEAHVLQGQVRVQPLETTFDGRRSVLLSEGQGMRVDHAKTAARIDAEQDRFPGAAEKFRPFKPITMFNTGINQAEGDEDSHWRISAGPDGGSYRGPQFAVVSVADGRYAPNEVDRSQWISMAEELRPGALPNSVFTYETEFDLTGFDLKTVMVAAQVLADNGVRSIRINGTPVDMQAWEDNEYGQSFTRNRFRLVEIQSGFVPGVNKIEIDVWNGVYQLESIKDDPNPMALRVEFQAYGRLQESAELAAAGSNRRGPTKQR